MHYDFDSDDFCKRFLSECLRQNLDLAQRTLKLFKNSNCQDKDDIFSIISIAMLFNHAPPPISEALEKFIPVLNTLEELEKSGHLDQVMNVIAFFVQKQQYLHEKNINYLKKCQTQKANDEKFHKYTSACCELEEYLIEVENLWHPPETASFQQRNTRTNKKRAIKIVYDKNRQKITEILHSLKFKGDCQRQFLNYFDFYTQFYLTYNNGKTRNGHTMEKRAARSEESKKRTSNTMKRKFQKTSSK